MSTEDVSVSDGEAPGGATGERWAPVGAVASPEEDEEERGGRRSGRTGIDPPPGASDAGSPRSRLRRLEEEREQLRAALLAVSSHFAQVQFRLQQVARAPADEKERSRMLQELEEFAFRGCPHVLGLKGCENPVSGGGGGVINADFSVDGVVMLVLKLVLC